MKRMMNLSEETDGKLYKRDSLVALKCDGCSGEAICCRDTDDTIILDPYDFYELQVALGTTFEKGYGKFFELRVVDGITLPYLLKDKASSNCILLAGGRCSIHAHRPGFCRLFPLGRMYNDEGFDYFLQTNQCPCKPDKECTVAEWLGIENLEKYEEYVQSWHEITEVRQKEAMGAAISEKGQSMHENSGYILNISMQLLRTFYISPYDTARDFYEQYYERLSSLNVR